VSPGSLEEDHFGRDSNYISDTLGQWLWAWEFCSDA